MTKENNFFLNALVKKRRYGKSNIIQKKKIYIL